MPESTPLLLLLNELISQTSNGDDDDDNQNQPENNQQNQPQHQLQQQPEAALSGVQRALDQIRALVNLGPMSLPLDSRSIVTIISTLLKAHPQMAQVASANDRSLPLHFAASLGDTEVAAVLVHHYPAGACQPNKKGKIPLHYAAREGRTDMVRFFMQCAPQTAAIATKKDKLAVHFAAAEGHSAIVQHLLAAYPRGASAPSAKGKVPLHFAARWGHMSIASDLLYFFPDGIRTLDWEGSLPLHDATREGQFLMARFLVERFPAALATANLRGDIPLFPAVRSGNTDLVVYLIQAWPDGGKHVLQNVSEEDCIADWSWSFTELLIRGAVDNFQGCALLQGREPPILRLTSQLNSVVVGEPMDEDSPESTRSNSPPTVPHVCLYYYHQNEKTTIPLKDTIEHRIPVFSDSTAPSLCSNPSPSLSSVNSKRSNGKLKIRSKSPTLNEGGSSKRSKSCHAGCSRFSECNRECSEKQVATPKFLPLHSALQCDATPPVISYILDWQEQHYSEQDIFETDDFGRTALHHAVRWAKNDESRASLVLSRILSRFPRAASQADTENTYPILEAVCANVHVKLLTALIDADPPSAIGETNGGKRPIEIACERGCDICTVYQLLRVDPSFLENFV